MPIFRSHLRSIASILAISLTIPSILAAENWQPVEVQTRGPLHDLYQHPDGEIFYHYDGRFRRSDDGGGVWVELPVHDFVISSDFRLHFHPSESEILATYAFPYDGRFPGDGVPLISTDSGRSWTAGTTPGGPDPTGNFDLVGFDHVGSLFGFRQYPERFLVRSDDLGQSWIPVAVPEGFEAAYPKFASGKTGTVLLLISQSGWAFSYDRGESFVIRPRLTSVRSLEMADQDPNRLLFQTGDESYLYSADGGASVVGIGGYRVQLHPRQPEWLVKTDFTDDFSGSALELSRDGGLTWSSWEVTGARPNFPLTFDPCDDEVVFLPAWRQDGLVKIRLEDGTSEEMSASPGQLAVQQTFPRKASCGLLVDTQLGLYSVSEQGRDWRQTGVGLPAAGFRHFAYDSSNVDHVWAATSAGLARSSDGGRSWSWIGATFGRPFDHVLVSADSRRVLAFPSYSPPLLSSDGGETFESAEYSGGRPAVDPHNAGELLVASGTGWLKIGDWGARVIGEVSFEDTSHQSFFEVAFDPGTPGLVYAVSRLLDALYVSTDGGLNFELHRSLEDIEDVTWGIAVDGDGTIYLRGPERMARSMDGGQTFEYLPAIDALPETAILGWVIPDNRDPDALFVIGAVYGAAAEGGNGLVFLRSEDDGQSFSDESTGLRRSGIDGWGFGQSLADPELWLYGGLTLYRRDVAEPDACAGSDEVLCLRDDRFEVRLRFGDIGDGLRPAAQTVSARTNDSGLFTFFDADNWELMVKVLDACPLNQKHWVIAAATTDQSYSLTITDRQTGAVRSFHNPPGQRSPAIIDTEAFGGCGESATDSGGGSVVAVSNAAVSNAAVSNAAVPNVGAAQPGEIAAALGLGSTMPATKAGDCPGDLLCLQDGRFEVGVGWQDFQGQRGTADPVDVQSVDSGLFTFFDANNWELMVKVLDACAINGHRWVLGAATTNVGYDMVVTDTESSLAKVYSNAVGTLSPAIIDIEAFPCAAP